MKLLNSDEPMPEVFYVFVNLRSPITAHNFAVGGFTSAAFNSFGVDGFLEKYLEGSARYLPYEPVRTDLPAASPFLMSTVGNYRVEYDVESFRERHHPLLPSRLSAIYAFGSADACKLACDRYQWDIRQVRRFRLRDHILNRVARVDMELISLARQSYGMPDAFCQHYWSGRSAQIGEYEPLWEYLIEGVLERLD